MGCVDPKTNAPHAAPLLLVGAARAVRGGRVGDRGLRGRSRDVDVDVLGGPLSARGVDVIDDDGLGRDLGGLLLDRVVVLVVDVLVPEHERVDARRVGVAEDRDRVVETVLALRSVEALLVGVDLAVLLALVVEDEEDLRALRLLALLAHVGCPNFRRVCAFAPIYNNIFTVLFQLFTLLRYNKKYK